MLVDEVTIQVKAGDGGNGAVSFRREKYVPKGGPDGGNGGKGGDICFLGVTDLTALRRFRYKKDFEAENGKPGLPRKKAGEDGKDLVLKLPVGTLITDKHSGEKFEILRAGEKIKVASGGFGGRGNFEFRSSTNTTPKQFERGGRGQKRRLYLELQIIADVGLIGLPNAGKSSLLNALTRASAKVANYPFTTLEPNLGVVNNLILADIPGLIEGASEGKGLGYKFLRHVRRTKILAHCISVETKNIDNDYQVVRHEIGQFDKTLLEKPEIILLTKIDLVDKSQLKKITHKLKKLQQEVIPTSIHKPKTLTKLRSRFSSFVV